MADDNKKAVYRHRKKKPRRPSIYDPSEEDTLRGQMITDVRESSDPMQAVRDKLCLWQTGNDIIPLVMLVKQDQMCPSWRVAAEVAEEVSEKGDLETNMSQTPMNYDIDLTPRPEEFHTKSSKHSSKHHKDHKSPSRSAKHSNEGIHVRSTHEAKRSHHNK